MRSSRLSLEAELVAQQRKYQQKQHRLQQLREQRRLLKQHARTRGRLVQLSRKMQTDKLVAMEDDVLSFSATPEPLSVHAQRRPTKPDKIDVKDRDSVQ